MADQRISVVARIADATTLTQGLAVDASGRISVLGITNALPAGTNNIGDVDVLSVVPGVTATSLGKAEDAAHNTGDTGVFVLAVRSDTAAATGGTDGDYCALVVDSAGKLHVNVGNTVTVSATNLDVRDLTQASDNVRVYANTAKDGSGTGYVPLVDTDGHLQVDVLSGGGALTPTNASTDITNLTTPVNLAAGASGNADSGSLDSKYLWQVVISGSVAFKATLGTMDDASIVNKVVLIGGPDAPVVYTPRPGFIQAPAAGAGTQGFRTAITNLDTSETADFYVTYFAADNAG
jgi:hypothetical protein